MTARPDFLRPRAAAERFGVAEKTLSRWAAAGLIGRSQPSGRTVYYRASDIADLIASSEKRRRVVPIAAGTGPATAPDLSDADAAYVEAFWSGASR